MEQRAPPPVHHSESTASFSSSVSDWGSEEHVSDLGIKLQPGTPLYQVQVDELHPTQLCVGMQQVHEKMNKLQKKQDKGPDALNKFLYSHPVPVVVGPGGRHYLIDHHHLARAMHEKGIMTCYAGTVLDLSELTPEQFWVAMGKRNLLWRSGPDGTSLEVRQLAEMLPNKVADMADDPYRSLAALVRKAGGYTKSTKPFAEFIWANHLRTRVPMVLVANTDVEAYVQHALSHAMHIEAAALPGYTLLQPAAASATTAAAPPSITILQPAVAAAAAPPGTTLLQPAAAAAPPGVTLLQPPETKKVVLVGEVGNMEGKLAVADAES